MHGIYRRIFDLARPFLDTRNNELHTRIAYSFAEKLLAAEGGDEAVVLPAIILHDTGWKSIPPELHLKAFGPGEIDLNLNRVHEVEGSETARRLLEKIGYDADRVEEIVRIVEGHDSRQEAFSLNDALVKDADKLWRYSVEALEIDPKRFKVDPEAHVAWLEKQIDVWFLTDTARSLARERLSRAATGQ